MSSLPQAGCSEGGVSPSLRADDGCSHGAASPSLRADAPTQRGDYSTRGGCSMRGGYSTGGYRARACRVLCACALLVLVSCQPGKRLTKANVDQVTTGMAKKQVESILGMPTSVETKQLDLTTKTTYIYSQGNESVTITFWDDKLETKESTISP